MGNLSVMDRSKWDTKPLDTLTYEEVLAVVKSSRLVPVGELNNQCLGLTFEVVAGPLKGQLISRFMHVWCRRDDDADVYKGRAAFSRLLRALEMEQPTDSSQLHGRLLVLTLSRKRGEEDTPQVDFLSCSMAKDEENRRWLKNEAKSLFNGVARKEQKPEGQQ